MSARDGGAVRAGDVFRYDATRWATVMEVLPGGRVFIRVSGTRNGKPTISTGEYRVRNIKTWERCGRAEFADGSYLPLDHAMLAARSDS